MKIVLIGAGSESFGRGQIADILQAPEWRGRDVTLCLVDVDEAALDRMTRLARRMREAVRSAVRVESTTDRCLALPGANYVIVAVARHRYELWEQDFRIPLSFGFRHVLGENGGPGAAFHALRSFELILPICRDIERLCPDALMLNFTNPEARVLHAVCRLTRVKAVGLCHGVFEALHRLSAYLGKPQEELDIVSAGMNHFYAILKAADRRTGEDLLPKAVQLAASDRSPATSPLFREFARVFGVFTFPSENHIGEYLSFGSEFHGVRWDYGIESRRVASPARAKPDPVGEYLRGERPADDPEILGRTGEIAVPIIADVELDRGAFRPAVNVLNGEGYIENLPRDAAVEVPARVDAAGVHPLKVGPLPEAFAAFMRPQFAIHSLLTEAYRTRSKKLLLQALLLDPCVDSIRRAEALLDRMLDLQRDFLPAFQEDLA